MRKGVGILVLVTATMAGGLGGPWVVERISGIELFRVTEVVVEGGHYLTAEEIRSVAAVPRGASLWDDLAPVLERLRAHPGIRDAKAERRPPGTVVLLIEEREPVAMVPSPTLTPVDAEGAVLPFDPALERLDLPLLSPRREAVPGGAAEAGAPLSPAELRVLTAELDWLGRTLPDLVASTSDVALDDWGSVVLHLDQLRVLLRYPPPLSPRRLQEALLAFEDAVRRNPGHPPVELDLRFQEQVVVGFSPPPARGGVAP